MNKEIEEVVKELSVVIEAMASEKNSKIKGVLDTEIRKAVMYQKADWLRSEIEKIVLPTPPDVLIPNESPIEHALREGEYHAFTSIITRYKKELLELEKGK